MVNFHNGLSYSILGFTSTWWSMLLQTVDLQEKNKPKPPTKGHRPVLAVLHEHQQTQRIYFVFSAPTKSAEMLKVRVSSHTYACMWCVYKLLNTYIYLHINIYIYIYTYQYIYTNNITIWLHIISCIHMYIYI